jgi:drug/metabolite transporter (DMT)-like permease
MALERQAGPAILSSGAGPAILSSGAGERAHAADVRKTGVPAVLSIPRRLFRAFLNPYVQLAIGAMLVTASELLMKKGASSLPAGTVGWLGIGALGSGWTWAGIVTYVLSFFSWIYVLRLLPLGIAYALINVVHVLIPIGAWAFLHEAVPLRRWLGILLVVAGLLLILKPVIKAEQKL